VSEALGFGGAPKAAVEGDVTARAEVAQIHPGLFSLLTADEEAALCLQHQGRVGCLQIRDGLRRHGPGHAEDARNRDDGEHGRSARDRESLTFHAQSPRDEAAETAPTGHS
jgi:hypothetical protein